MRENLINKGISVMTIETPNPGSNEALDLGCICPVLDNGHGLGYLGGAKDAEGNTLFVYNLECPVHKNKDFTKT